ncbi:MAG: ABC transporter substrate-binding protein, partial [Ruminococcus sp.]|nr:ABC transporter substrate-binding protein [Ruminococcus sp.]
MKRILALILAASFVLPLFSCGDESDDTSQSDGSGMMYNASLLNNPESLDPQYACDEASNTVIANLYSGLMKFADDGTAVCCNAESYSISEDGLTYTFNLRSDNYWFFDENDDDTVDDEECFPVTAEDYVFALQRVLDPEMQSPYSEYFTCIKGGEAAANGTSSADSIGVYAADSSTLV